MRNSFFMIYLLSSIFILNPCWYWTTGEQKNKSVTNAVYSNHPAPLKGQWMNCYRWCFFMG